MRALRSFLIPLVTTLLIAPILALADTPQDGMVPVPTFTGVSVSVVLQYDPNSSDYTYAYSISNPASNTGQVWNFILDVTSPENDYSYGTYYALTLPRGAAGAVPWTTLVSRLQQQVTLQHKLTIVPFGMTAPSGWVGSMANDGTAGFAATNGTPLITPGSTNNGFSVVSPGLPSIRKMTFFTQWEFAPQDDSSDTDAAEALADQIYQSLQVTAWTLGPTGFGPGTFGNWNQLQGDLNTAMQIGWISDTTFGLSLVSQLAQARQVMSQQGLPYTVAALQTLLNTINSGSPSQFNQQAHDLLFYNVSAMLAEATIESQSPPPPQQQFSPKMMIISPSAATVSLPVGASVTVTAKVTDQAQNGAPVPNFSAPIYVQSGPDSGQSNGGQTDGNGQISLTYTGQALGTDTVTVNKTDFSGDFYPQDFVRINWTGGPDLVVKSFTPPLLHWDGTSQIHINDMTLNQGTTAAGVTTTRYYVSTTSPVDPTVAQVVGQRQVPALAPGASSISGDQVLSLPAGLGAGTVYLLACANADNTVVETNYQNNCLSSQTVALLKRSALPPDCSHSLASPNSLWPPNHKFVTINITGVTDPQNLAVTSVVTSIMQDEPVDEKGSGNTGPDGTGLGAATAQVRAERSGTGNGRLYFIGFTATDTQNQSCKGTVMVGVPHDQSGSGPVDTGQRYDSTQK